MAAAAARKGTHMARHIMERQIGRYLSRVTQLGALEGERMAWKLAKLLAPSAAAAADGFAAAPSRPSGAEGEQGVAEMIAMVLGATGGLTRLIELVDPAELERMQLVLAKYTEVVLAPDRTPNLEKAFDEHFAGHYDWLAEWFRFALEVN